MNDDLFQSMLWPVLVWRSLTADVFCSFSRPGSSLFHSCHIWCHMSFSPLPPSLFPRQDVHSQGEVIACLEKALVREAEQQDHVRPIKEECQRAILRVAELSSDDFHLDRHLYFSCRDDRERFCQNVRRLRCRIQNSFYMQITLKWYFIGVQINYLLIGLHPNM